MGWLAVALGLLVLALADGSHVRTLKGHTGWLTPACVMLDGQHMVTASDDNTARVWLLTEI